MTNVHTQLTVSDSYFYHWLMTTDRLYQLAIVHTSSQKTTVSYVNKHKRRWDCLSEACEISGLNTTINTVVFIMTTTAIYIMH